MSHRRNARYSGFDRIKTFVLDKIKKHKTMTLVQLQRVLLYDFGHTYFHKQRNIHILMKVMEYLLYTKRLTIINLNEQRILLTAAETSFSRDNNDDNNRIVMHNIITTELLFKYKNNFHMKQSNILAQNICTVFDPLHIALSRNRLQDQIITEFNNKIKHSGYPISNQNGTGRSWMYACLNVIRIPFMKKYNIDQFEFSEAYLFFWDKIERCNYFLNAIVTTAKKGHTLDSRTVMALLNSPIEDGGYWTMAVNLIKKYGLMPKINFPEYHNSEHCSDLNEILSSKLREFAIILRDMVTNNAKNRQISAKIQENLCVVYRIVGICFGIPKQTFKWYRFNSKSIASYIRVTPLEFYKRIVRPVINLDDKVSLICDPRLKLKFGQLYTLDFIGNVTEGSKIVYNNQPIEVLLEACKNSIITFDEPVWYTCEMNQKFSRELGIEDLHIHDVKSIFGTDISTTMTKSERISYRDSGLKQAMLLTGVHTEKDNVTRWRVENSWGDTINTDGNVMMTTEWFKEYVFEVVVDKKLLPKNVMSVFQQKPIALPLWDQIGAFSFVN